MDWNKLQEVDQLPDLIQESAEKNILIFKFSTRCSISRTAFDRLERSWGNDDHNIKLYFLDLIAHRAVSNLVAQQFDVEHESPQVLLIRNGKSFYHRSHFEIDSEKIKEALRS